MAPCDEWCTPRVCSRSSTIHYGPVQETVYSHYIALYSTDVFKKHNIASQYTAIAILLATSVGTSKLINHITLSTFAADGNSLIIPYTGL